MNTFQPAMIPEFDALLAKREAQLCATLHAREAQLESADTDQVNDFKDLAADEAIAAVDEIQAENAAHELEQVVGARSRLKDFTYGVCRDCGKAIDLRRLRAMPATALCTSCQETREVHTAPTRQ